MATSLAQPVARQVWAALRMLVVMTVVLGLGYPLSMTGLAQVALPGRADGSLVEKDGRAVGSSLIGQSFDAHPAYFQSRPSSAGDGYDPLTVPGKVAPDALLASGSGLDPHISPQYAEQQVARIARERGLSDAAVRALVEESTSGRILGFLGEPAVNVLLLCLALDAASQQAE